MMKVYLDSLMFIKIINFIMLKTVKAKINKKGEVKLLEPIKIDSEKNAIVTVLDDEIDWSKPIFNETALLSELLCQNIGIDLRKTKHGKIYNRRYCRN